MKRGNLSKKEMQQQQDDFISSMMVSLDEICELQDKDGEIENACYKSAFAETKDRITGAVHQVQIVLEYDKRKWLPEKGAVCIPPDK